MRPVAISAPSFAARSAAVAWSASGRSRPFTSRSRSRARSSSDETRASFDSARTRRRWYLPSPAASSTNRRRSCGFESRISSTLPWPITECISRPRPVSDRSSRTSRRRTRARFTRYSLSPPRSSRRMTETSLNSRGSVPHSLSSTSSTSQTPAGGRPSDPAKSTSWPGGRAQLDGRGDGHRPLERVGDVGLARPVRADDHGDAMVEAELDASGKRLEAPHPQRLQVHRPRLRRTSPATTPGAPRAPAGPRAAPTPSCSSRSRGRARALPTIATDVYARW